MTLAIFTPGVCRSAEIHSNARRSFSPGGVTTLAIAPRVPRSHRDFEALPREREVQHAAGFRPDEHGHAVLEHALTGHAARHRHRRGIAAEAEAPILDRRQRIGVAR